MCGLRFEMRPKSTKPVSEYQLTLFGRSVGEALKIQQDAPKAAQQKRGPPKPIVRETGLARNTDPDTSQAAAQSFDPTRLEAVVLEVLRQHKEGLTSTEVADILGIGLWSISPRLRPLANKGLIRDSGRRKEGASKRKQIVWVAV